MNVSGSKPQLPNDVHYALTEIMLISDRLDKVEGKISDEVTKKQENSSEPQVAQEKTRRIFVKMDTNKEIFFENKGEPKTLKRWLMNLKRKFSIGGDTYQYEACFKRLQTLFQRIQDYGNTQNKDVKDLLEELHKGRYYGNTYKDLNVEEASKKIEELPKKLNAILDHIATKSGRDDPKSHTFQKPDMTNFEISEFQAIKKAPAPSPQQEAAPLAPPPIPKRASTEASQIQPAIQHNESATPPNEDIEGQEVTTGNRYNPPLSDKDLAMLAQQSERQTQTTSTDHIEVSNTIIIPPPQDAEPQPRITVPEKPKPPEPIEAHPEPTQSSRGGFLSDESTQSPTASEQTKEMLATSQQRKITPEHFGDNTQTPPPRPHRAKQRPKGAMATAASVSKGEAEPLPSQQEVSITSQQRQAPPKVTSAKPQRLPQPNLPIPKIEADPALEGMQFGFSYLPGSSTAIRKALNVALKWVRNNIASTVEDYIDSINEGRNLSDEVKQKHIEKLTNAINNFKLEAKWGWGEMDRALKKIVAELEVPYEIASQEEKQYLLDNMSQVLIAAQKASVTDKLKAIKEGVKMMLRDKLPDVAPKDSEGNKVRDYKVKPYKIAEYMYGKNPPSEE